jgi:hypothetical protein
MLPFIATWVFVPSICRRSMQLRAVGLMQWFVLLPRNSVALPRIYKVWLRQQQIRAHVLMLMTQIWPKLDPSLEDDNSTDPVVCCITWGLKRCKERQIVLLMLRGEQTFKLQPHNSEARRRTYPPIACNSPHAGVVSQNSTYATLFGTESNAFVDKSCFSLMQQWYHICCVPSPSIA